MKKSVFVFAFSAVAFISTQLSAQVGNSAPKQTSKTDSVSKANSSAVKAQTSVSENLVEAIEASGDATTLSTAIKTCGVESTLNNGAQYTIFAPNDKAFAKNKGKTDALFSDKAKEQKLIKNHIVKGRYTKDQIIKALTANKGTTTLTTVDGEKLTLKVTAEKYLQISDQDGNKADVTLFDLQGSNGVAHVVDNVLLN